MHLRPCRHLWIGPLALLLALGTVGVGRAADCGGAVPCACGDRVVADTVLTADIGPCAWPVGGGDELVGLRLDSDVVLDCAGHAILGPADATKQEFGIKTGSSTRAVTGSTLRACVVSGFWWGIHVNNSSGVTVEDNLVRDNGWFDPEVNGTGYGIDIADSQDVIVRRNQVLANGNEGIHLTSSEGVEVRDNLVADNGFEQLYVIHADRNDIIDNTTRGGHQGLEMRDSDENRFSGNQFLEAPLHWLEDDDLDNSFSYDQFEGTLRIGARSTGTQLSMVRIDAPGERCLDVRAGGMLADRLFFGDCGTTLETTAPVHLDRPVRLPLEAPPTGVSVVHPGCNADIAGDGFVDGADIAAVALAQGTSPGDVAWNPAADLDHDRTVGPGDADIAALQFGACPSRLRRPVAALRQSVLERGLPRRIELSALRSHGVSAGLAGYEMELRRFPDGALLGEWSFGAVDPATVRAEVTLGAGSYDALLDVTDGFFATSKRKRLRLRVR